MLIESNDRAQNVMMSSQDFGGCMKNIRLTYTPLHMEQYAVDMLDVNMDGCPEAAPSQQPCQTSLVEVVYEGHDNSTTDYDRLPFTGSST